MTKVISFIVLALTCHRGMQDYAGPKCLGPFCIDHRTPTLKLFEQLGPPARKAAPFCYESQSGQASLYIQTIDTEQDVAAEVLVSDFANCVHTAKRITTSNLYAWKTPEGIGLGSREVDVVKAYGKPSTEWKIDSTNLRGMRLIIHGFRPNDHAPHVGDKALSYAGDVSKDLSLAQFGIRKGQVCWIRLSMNE